MKPTTVSELLERYDVFLLDAYGVLVRSTGALPGAARFLQRLNEAGKHHLIVSNDASRSPATTLARYQGFGLSFSLEQIVTSGQLLPEYYARHGLGGAPTIVLGTEDSMEYVRLAGGQVVAPDDDGARVLVVADDDGYDFLETVNQVLTVLLRRMDRGERTHLVLPNPDLVFPHADGTYGFTSGAIAAMLEAILRLRDPGGGPRFVPLGKPHPPIFEAAMRRCPPEHQTDRRRIVMVGDQFGTDIRGAADFGLDTVFVETGIGRAEDAARFGVTPTWRLAQVG